MKNHIAFKFIAVLLCAASLLGTIGSIAGVVVLTEGDLYNKTVAEVKEERIRLNSMHYASNLAMMYASTELGGSPERMVMEAIEDYGFTQTYPNYGYTILDAEGNVLSSYNTELIGNVQTYTFRPTGQYMHLVSSEFQAEIDAREDQERIEAATGQYLTGIDGETVPDEGIRIDRVFFTDVNGNLIYEAYCEDGYNSHSICYDSDGNSHHSSFTGAQTGFLFYNGDNHLVYNSLLVEEGMETQEVAGIVFINEERGFAYSRNESESLGTISWINGQLCFVSNFEKEPVFVEIELAGGERTIPTIPTEPIEVTIPETTAAVTEETSVPAETAAEETAAAETTEESVPSSASAVPEETAATEAAKTTQPPETTAATQPPETTAPMDEIQALEVLPKETEPVINGKSLAEYQVNTLRYYDSEAQDWVSAKYVYIPMPELTVEMYVDTASMRDAAAYELLALVREYRSYLMPAIGICLLVFAVFTVYLCTAAGRKPKTEEVRAGGLNRMPLDLYLVGGGFGIALCVTYGVYGLQYLLEQNLLVSCAVSAGLFFLACLILVAFCFAFVAQIKTPGGFWWRNTLCGHMIRLFMQFGAWLENFLSAKGFPWLGRSIKKLWKFTGKSVVWLYHTFENAVLWIGDKLGKIFRWLGKKLHRFLSLLPLTWQWLGGGFFLVFVLLIGVDGFKDGSDMALPVALVLTMAVVIYVSHCFGLLFDSTKKMAKGDLDTKVEDKLMAGCFKEFAGDLNDLAGVAVVAAQKQLKSERMKTELITNVSHDIKTPLTSIINYVDLLQKPHSQEEEQQYLEVLDRQSQRLKKLIDDLMDMSKANTGNMQVDITEVDAVESVNQALGEFADKLDRAQLIPVFRHDDVQVPMMADGKLVWRVLSNLLGNAVKYAMPGTRLYIDLTAVEGKVILSLKNISREELNIDAEELMERFVRGDDSRNTEGSGLGLNIAKSLMELQKGQLQLLVDGDLFKVTLIFPGV